MQLSFNLSYIMMANFFYISIINKKKLDKITIALHNVFIKYLIERPSHGEPETRRSSKVD